MTQHPTTRFPEPSAAARAALAPTGVLRAGINLSNFLLVSSVGSDGTPVGVSPSMASALAASLGVGVELITFPNPGDVADAAPTGVWDVGNIGADPARATHIWFSHPYAQIEATYIVRQDSPFTSVSDVDARGVTITSKARAAYSLWLEANIEHADLVLTASPDESLARFMTGEADVLAGLRPRLEDDLGRIDDARMLAGRFMAVRQAMGTPNDRDPAGRAFLDEFVGVALSTGFVADLITHHGASGLTPAD